jgi:peptidoglycan/LPS O-acetylase OafA/YrhL
MNYRADVDGLRAVAVGLVVLFHAGLGFEGGYIGVDVFLVISGFLITGLINKSLRENKFSLKDFWIRRIRRIIPAASLVALVTFILGAWLLPPSECAALGKSVLCQQAMLSNWHFWRNTGYFDGNADLMPMLHTWSLSVEEQFYLAYPLLLWLLAKTSQRAAGATLLLLALVSFAISEAGVTQGMSSSFFLLPSRSWELLLGALLHYLPAHRSAPPWLLGLVNMASLACIVGAGCMYNAQTAFPGMSATLPCLATAAFIYSNSDTVTWPSRLLTSRLAVGVGLASYSLYLWHWPIIVFARRLCDGEMSVTARLLALGIGGVLAFFSWRFFETPIRRAGQSWPWSRTICAWLASFILISSLAAWAWKSDGFLRAYSNDVQRLDPASVDVPIFRFEMQGREFEPKKVVALGAKRVTGQRLDLVVLGDSHAMSVGAYLDRTCARIGIAGAMVARRSTCPLIGLSNQIQTQEENQWVADAFRWIDKERPRRVLLIGRWNRQFEDIGRAVGERLPDTCDILQRAGIEVAILLQVPEFAFHPPQVLWTALRTGGSRPQGTTLQASERYGSAMLKATRALAASVVLLDPKAACFGPDARARYFSGSGAFYRDQHHLSEFGAANLTGPILEPWLAQLR